MVRELALATPSERRTASEPAVSKNRAIGWVICLPGDSLLTLGAGLSHDRAQPTTFSILSQGSVADPPSFDDEARGLAEATVAFGPRLDGQLR